MLKQIVSIFSRIGKVNQLILITSVVSIGMVLARIIYSGQWTYIFLGWNLFLAWIPYGISYSLSRRQRLWRNDFQLLLWTSLWLLFYPNAPYIVTDLFHLAEHEGAPKWYDLLMIMTFTWNGLILGILSLLDMHSLAEKRRGKQFALGFVFVVIVLTGFGVYLGRYERWNSWDLFINTRELLSDVFYLVFYPARNLKVYGFTLFFSVFQAMLYFIFFHFHSNSTSSRIRGIEFQKLKV